MPPSRRSSRPPRHPVDPAPATSTLSESDSKALLAPFGIPFADERIVATPAAAGAAARELGLPVVVKLCGAAIAHKTERGLVRLGLADVESVIGAAAELLALARAEDGAVQLLVAPMIRGTREFIAGISRDPHFGLTVMVGVGGVLAEAIGDVSVRLVPIVRSDAAQMLADLDNQSLLDEFRGEPAVDREAMIDVLVSLADAALHASFPGRGELVSIDLNPLIICAGRPVAVDALVELNR